MPEKKNPGKLIVINFIFYLALDQNMFHPGHYQQEI